jgi:hypothetical protein
MYNFFVPKVGGVIEGRPIWAADADAWGHNDDSLSVCFEGNFMLEHMTQAQIDTGIGLTRWLMAQYPTIETVCGHKDVNSDTECPGTHFDKIIIVEGMKPAPPITSGVTMTATATAIPPKETPLLVLTLEDALRVNVKHGTMLSPEYWREKAKTVPHLDTYIINVAKTLEKYKNNF